ncbi:MAG: hypothetical protein ACK5P0_01930 [bacterium]|jgi:hypothetical protein
MEIKKLIRIISASLLAFGFNLWLPENANATCVNFIQSQTIAAAYNGDAEPTVHHMDTCSGDDISYQIPIATTVTFDGVQYENIYATTNSVITFGQPDGTFHTYPSTPSISLYSMDWYPGVSGTSGLDIYYSEGGFQMNLNMVPFGNYGAQPSTVNILVAITNTGGLAVSYSYQGPEYQNLRTGVRLHNGDIVSLEAWGATQVSPNSPAPTLQAEPIPEPSPTPTQQPSPEPSPTPTEAPITPEEQQEQVAEAAQLAEEISDLNNLIASINGEEINEPGPDLTTEPEPEPSPEPTNETDLPDPDVEVDPEIIDEEDPRFPDGEEQTEPDDPTPSPSPDTTDGEIEESNPTPEPSEEPSPQPTDTDPTQEPEPEQPADEDSVVAPDNDSTDSNPISADELNKLNKLIGQNDAKLAAELSNMLTELSQSEEKALANELGIKEEDVAAIAELIKDDPKIAVAFVEFAGRAEENADAPMPYTLADAVTEVQTEAFLSDPLGAVFNVDVTELLSNFSELGMDMTDDQREKAQEVIIPVVLVSNIVSAVIGMRR